MISSFDPIETPAIREMLKLATQELRPEHRLELALHLIEAVEGPVSGRGDAIHIAACRLRDIAVASIRADLRKKLDLPDIQ